MSSRETARTVSSSTAASLALFHSDPAQGASRLVEKEQDPDPWTVFPGLNTEGSLVSYARCLRWVGLNWCLIEDIREAALQKQTTGIGHRFLAKGNFEMRSEAGSYCLKPISVSQVCGGRQSKSVFERTLLLSALLAVQGADCKQLPNILSRPAGTSPDSHGPPDRVTQRI
jgi:hypothetical protein